MKPPGAELLASMAAAALRLWMFVGIMLRVTRMRDAFDPLAIVFYTTPWPALFVGFITLALHSRRVGKRHAMHRNLVLGAGALFTWFALSWNFAPEAAPKPADLRVVFWNVSSPEKRLSWQAGWLRRQDSDIIALAEAEPQEGSGIARWQQEFPGYVVIASPGNLLCLIRGELLESDSGELGKGSRFARLRVRVKGRTLTVIQADLSAAPLRSRREPLRRLTELASAEVGAVILLGDFNTPRESAHFDEMRRSFRHAFDTAGTGLAETWPLPAPVLSLDHIWTSASVEPVACWQGRTPLSDHRAVVAELALQDVKR
jgi:endonuclease/exonuclease/phosphatase (EEP) superfamily protein YafD